VLIGMEHADAAKRPVPEMPSAKDEPASEPTQPEPTPEVAKNCSAADVKSSTVQIETEIKAVEPVGPQEVTTVGTCEACGFPVSGGRKLCLDCEAARQSGAHTGLSTGSDVPAFLSQFGNAKEKSWLASNIYTIGTILITLLTVGILVLRFR
jgi:hypothetical protein